MMKPEGLSALIDRLDNRILSNAPCPDADLLTICRQIAADQKLMIEQIAGARNAGEVADLRRRVIAGRLR